MSYYLTPKIDFEQHNAEVEELWKRFAQNLHERIPVTIGGSIRNLFSNPEINQTGLTFEDFFTSGRAQIIAQLHFAHYMRHHWYCDRPMGLPDAWWVGLDFQNSGEQAWFGAPFIYFGATDVPDTLEILRDEPELVEKDGLPDPFCGRGDFMKKVMDMYEEMSKIVDSGYEFCGRPVKLAKSLILPRSDGIFTLALKLRGTVECMCDMYENPDYFHRLMQYLTTATILRIKAHRNWAAAAPISDFRGEFFYSDDSIAMLSQTQFQEFVLPYMEQIYREFSDYSNNQIHLCGDATHHFKFLTEHFKMKMFDTGFPVDHGKLRMELGDDVTIQGGPTIMLLQNGRRDEITAQVKRILQSGVLHGGRFVLKEGNNLAPCTSVENLLAFYQAGKIYGSI